MSELKESQNHKAFGVFMIWKCKLLLRPKVKAQDYKHQESTQEKYIFTCWVNLYDFSKVSLSDFLQSDLFQKNQKKKSGILVSNSLDPDQVQCVLGPVCDKRQAWSRSKTVLVDTSRWRVNRLLHFCDILFALSMYALNEFFLPIICINLGMFHYI